MAIGRCHRPIKSTMNDNNCTQDRFFHSVSIDKEVMHIGTEFTGWKMCPNRHQVFHDLRPARLHRRL
jgi:hypothetical protein